MFEGSLDDYPQWLLDRDKAGLAELEKGSAENSAGARTERKRLEAELRRSLDPLRKTVQQAENTMELLHARQQALHLELADPQLYEPGSKDKLLRLLGEKAEVEKSCSEAEEQWMEASEKLEKARSGMESPG